MQVLTPSGYRSPVDLVNGDEVCAFDAETGAPIINHVENIDVVDYAEWCRWWQVEAAVPAFIWIRVNGSLLLFGEQSIWRNGTNVCHAKHLVVGDETYDDADLPVAITSIEVVEDKSLIWYRFDIDGDHSYIIDGLTVHNASRFWVGGTGTWDSSTTTNWASSSGGAGGASVPSSADTVTFNGSSGGGTVTLNYGGSITIQSISMGAFTGTWDNSVNNNNFTLSASTLTFNNTGTGTRNIKLGSAIYTLTGDTSAWNWSATNLTFSGGSESIVFNGASGTRSFTGGSLAYGNLTFAASAGAGYCNISGSNTFDSLSISAPNFVLFTSSVTTTISTSFTWNGTSTGLIYFGSSTVATQAFIASADDSKAQYCAFRDMSFTGSPVATSSFDLGNNSGITITPPGGGSPGVIGS